MNVGQEPARITAKGRIVDRIPDLAAHQLELVGARIERIGVVVDVEAAARFQQLALQRPRRRVANLGVEVVGDGPGVDGAGLVIGLGIARRELADLGLDVVAGKAGRLGRPELVDGARTRRRRAFVALGQCGDELVGTLQLWVRHRPMATPRIEGPTSGRSALGRACRRRGRNAGRIALAARRG